MITSRSLRIAGALLIAAGLSVAPGSTRAAESSVELLSKSWQHEGMFGTYDRSAAQRGFQVYREICSACHGAKYLAFRNLRDLGFSEDEVKALAAEYTVVDGPNDEGEMFERPARPSDYLPSPYANEAEAAYLNGGAAPPDLSLITKARPDGTNYLYSLMRGYTEPPADIEIREGSYYNEFYAGHWIAMPQPLYDDMVEYADGTPATLEQLSADISVFLAWAAEPKLEERKQTGLKVLLFLIVLTALFYATKRIVWADAH